MINAKDTVTFSVGGQIFITRKSNLYRLPDSRLYMLAVQNSCGEDDVQIPSRSLNNNNTQTIDFTSRRQPIYFFDRDPEIFRFVLDYYRTGELHLPSGICGPFVRKELIFWGIDESYILPCCMPAYMRYEEERRTKRTLFRDCFEDLDSIKNLLLCCRGWKKLRYQIWLFLEYPESSISAKCWALLLLVFMIASVMCFCLSTHEAFRLPVDKNQTDSNKQYSSYFFNNSNLTFCSSKKLFSNPKFRKDCTTEPAWGLVFTDILLNLIFTVDFLLKALLAPDKRKFLQTVISQLDIVILCSYWVYISVFYFHSLHDTLIFGTNAEAGSVHLWLMNILSLSQVLRILRIFRISKISRGLQVLILTVKKSIPELVLLAFLLMNGMFLFSALIYMAEYQQYDTFPDIPQGFWWSIITLTTVGYGDFYPKGGLGYFIGSIAAISGCIVTGLAIPIIGNNFNTYYKYMQNQLKEDKYIRQLRKDMNDVISNTNSTFGNSPCPGMFRDHYGNQSKNRRNRRARIDTDLKSNLTSNGGVNRRKLKRCSPDSSINRFIPKLILPHSKGSRNSPTSSKNDTSTTNESIALLTPKKASSDITRLNSFDRFEKIEMSPNLSSLTSEIISNKHFIDTSHESLVNTASIVTDNDKVIESPTIRKLSAQEHSFSYLHYPKNGDYV